MAAAGLLERPGVEIPTEYELAPQLGESGGGNDRRDNMGFSGDDGNHTPQGNPGRRGCLSRFVPSALFYFKANAQAFQKEFRRMITVEETQRPQ